MLSPSDHRHPAPGVGLIAALARELTPWLRGEHRRHLPGHIPGWRVASAPGPVVALVSGMGPVAASRAADTLIGEHRAWGLVSLGFGGALAPGLPAGALVLSQTCWRFDPDSQTLTPQPMDQDPKLVVELLALLEQAGLAAFVGTLISTPVIIAKADHAAHLIHLSHPVLDLESAAVAAVARHRHVPFLGLRAVTDTAGEDIPAFLARHLNAYREPTATQVLGAILRKPRRLPRLGSLGGRARLASRVLAQALRLILPVLHGRWGMDNRQCSRIGKP